MQEKKLTVEFSYVGLRTRNKLRSMSKAKGKSVGFNASYAMTFFHQMLKDYEWVRYVRRITSKVIKQYRENLDRLELALDDDFMPLSMKNVLEELCVGSISIAGRNFVPFYEYGKKINEYLIKRGIEGDVFDLKRELDLSKLCPFGGAK